MAARFQRNLVFSGLGTACSIRVPEAGRYSVDGKISLSSIAQGSTGNSAVVAVINKNGSPVYTGSAGSRGLYSPVDCAANDVITVVLSSSATVDVQLNAVKSNISVAFQE